MKSYSIEDILFVDIETTNSDAYSGESNRVICICVGKFGVDSKRFLNLRSFYNENETKLLLEFNNFLLNFSKETILCAHNAHELNFPLLHERMSVNGITSASILSNKAILNNLELIDASEFLNTTNFKSSKLKNQSDEQLEDIVSYSFKDIVSIAQNLLRFKNLSSESTENIYYV